MRHSPAPAYRPALLIIDMQQGLFNGPERPFEGARVLDRINGLTGRARQAGAPIFFARHTGPAGSPLAPDSPLTQLLPDLDHAAGTDKVFTKTRPNCFMETELAAWLDACGAQSLFIAGMKTEFCVDATCRAAADLGLRPVLVADAHTTTGSASLSAKDIIDHHNRTLAGAFATLAKAEDCLF